MFLVPLLSPAHSPDPPPPRLFCSHLHRDRGFLSSGEGPELPSPCTPEPSKSNPADSLLLSNPFCLLFCHRRCTLDIVCLLRAMIGAEVCAVEGETNRTPSRTQSLILPLGSATRARSCPVHNGTGAGISATFRISPTSTDLSETYRAWFRIVRGP